MKKTKLKKYLEKNSQKDLSSKFGLAPSAISKMIAFNRDITVVIDGSDIELHEHKVVASTKNNASN